jgi:hypothetical protein
VNKTWAVVTPSADATGAAGQPWLAARFVWQRDRFTHQIVCGWSDQERVLLQSVEGSDVQDFPPSPPLQDMSVEARGAGQVALGVGMAGGAMWSLSVAADGHLPQLEFDWACQARGAEIWPRNCYVSLPDAGPANWAADEVVLFRLNEPEGSCREVRLTLAAATGGLLPPSYQIARQEPPLPAEYSLAVNLPADCSVVRVEDRDVAVTGRTALRWQYRIQWQTL